MTRPALDDDSYAGTDDFWVELEAEAECFAVSEARRKK